MFYAAGSIANEAQQVLQRKYAGRNDSTAARL